MNNIFSCPFCNKTFETSASEHLHEVKCKLNPNYKLLPKTENWKNAMSKFKGVCLQPKCECSCDFCNKRFNYKSAKTLHQRYCANNPNREIYVSNCHHTNESLEKISNAQKASWQSGNRKPRVKRSYPEEYFSKIFTDAEMNYFQIGYFLDFAWIDKMCYVEVDGEQHYYFDERIQHDVERDENLKNIGWTCIARIRWSEFVKLSSTDKKQYIQKIKDGINNKIIIPDLKPTKSKSDIRKEHSAIIQQNRKIDRDKRIEIILSQTDIDFTKFGWAMKLSKIVGIKSAPLVRWIKKNMPEFYSNCYKEAG